jgi:hypothetical protein
MGDPMSSPEMARDLFKTGAMEEITLRKVEALCLPRKRPFQLEDIRRFRTASHVSQAAFAAILGIGEHDTGFYLVRQTGRNSQFKGRPHGFIQGQTPWLPSYRADFTI